MKSIASGINRSILLFCVICLLFVFTASKSIADSDIVPIGKPAQPPSESKKMKFADLLLFFSLLSRYNETGFNCGVRSYESHRP